MHHILVIRLSALGDVALMAPIVRRYAQSNPEARFTVAAPPLLQPLFDDMPNVQYLGLKKKQSFIKIYRILNAVGADAVADLHRVNRVGFALTLLRLRHLLNPHFRIRTIRKGRLSRFLFIHHLRTAPRKPQYQRYEEVFQRLGLRASGEGQPLHASEPAAQSPATVTIGLAPFSQHPGKIWPWENVCTLAMALAERNYKVLLFGSKEEAPKLESLADRHPLITSLAGRQPFADELHIIRGLSLMVSMDSANMHFASVLGVPVVSIWGATHPDFGFYPQQQPRANALCADLACQPCSPFGSRPCRYGDYRCLRAITPQAALEKIESLLPSPTDK